MRINGLYILGIIPIRSAVLMEVLLGFVLDRTGLNFLMFFKRMTYLAPLVNQYCRINFLPGMQIGARGIKGRGLERTIPIGFFQNLKEETYHRQFQVLQVMQCQSLGNGLPSQPTLRKCHKRIRPRQRNLLQNLFRHDCMAQLQNVCSFILHYLSQIISHFLIQLLSLIFSHTHNRVGCNSQLMYRLSIFNVQSSFICLFFLFDTCVTTIRSCFWRKTY